MRQVTRGDGADLNIVTDRTEGGIGSDGLSHCGDALLPVHILQMKRRDCSPQLFSFLVSLSLTVMITIVAFESGQDEKVSLTQSARYQ